MRATARTASAARPLAPEAPSSSRTRSSASRVRACNSGSINNAAVFEITSTGVVQGVGQYIQTGGTSIVNGTLEQNYIELQHGILSGGGTIKSPQTVLLGDTDRSTFTGLIVRTGMSPGRLTIDGDLEMRASSTLEIEVASASVHDVLAVTGRATFNGLLRLVFLDGYLPGAGQHISFLDLAGPHTVAFRGVEAVGPAGGLLFQGIVDASGITVSSVTAVPEPETYMLMLAGLLLMGCAAKRRIA